MRVPSAHHVLSQFREAGMMWEGEMGWYKIDLSLENLSVYRADQETEHPRGPPQLPSTSPLRAQPLGSDRQELLVEDSD